jgi:hypothetical protein
MRFDAEKAVFPRETLRMAPRVAERFRSGSPGVQIPDGYLFLINETIVLAGGEESTFSRFAHLDVHFRLRGISPQFFLDGNGQAMATGLTLRGDQLVAGFGSESGTAISATFDLATVLAHLTPVTAPGRLARPRYSNRV